MKVLVTGGAGFIGSHLVDRLIEMDFDVTVIDDLSTGKAENINKKATVIYNSTLNSTPNNQLIVDKILWEKYDYIFHLAANASVPFTVKHPVYSHKTNVDLTLEMLNAALFGFPAKKFTPKKFVFASSSAIYGNPKSLPTSENDQPNLLSPYALQKYTAEQYCELYRILYNFPTVSLRFFNVYGPRQNGTGPYANVISSWATRLVNNESIRLDGDGLQSRDFIYVDDVVDLLIESALNENIHGVYNVGTGEAFTIQNVLEIFKNHFNNMLIDKQLARVGDPLMTMADITKLSTVFGKKSFHNFKESLSKTIESYKVKK